MPETTNSSANPQTAVAPITAVAPTRTALAAASAAAPGADRLREVALENAIESVLLSGGPDAARATDTTWKPLQRARGPYVPGGYRKREPADYDRQACLDGGLLLDFVQTSQPLEWEKLVAKLGETEARNALVRDTAREIQSHGLIRVLRSPLKVQDVPFRLAYFPPSSGLNPEEGLRYRANIFSVIRQLRYSPRSEKSLDMVLFLNGLPFCTLELKNRFSGQSVDDAMRQYREDRDPKEPLLAPRRCVVHFAVDNETAYMTTELAGEKTEFLPFNQGRDGGAGNPRLLDNYATAYLWEQALSRDSVLNLLQHFVYEIERKKESSGNGGKRAQRTRHVLFPRYHQVEAVRMLVEDARNKGAGHKYLIQHSAGSGKSNSIGWLAHQLSLLHDAKNERVFTNILVVTDRRNLDRQLQDTVAGFERVRGTVRHANTSEDLARALNDNVDIIVTTIQKFPFILGEVQKRGERRFALILDEAHSSQSGEASREMSRALRAAGADEQEQLKEAERAETAAEEKSKTLDEVMLAEMEARGHLRNASYFAFTATPKPKTYEMFGARRPDGTFVAFHTYTMRQAIEEGFILDVLRSYITYRDYFQLVKTIAEDPIFEKVRATHLLTAFAKVHPELIREKVGAMLAHFEETVRNALGGEARAMIVTSSRLHAVRYKQAVDEYLRQHNRDYRALVAFSGTVADGGGEYTEALMNGLPETQTKDALKRDPYRILIVANKYQTGYDEPLLCGMYVDKKLRGVAAVQTLSRLNRVHPGKTEVWVLDFENQPEEIQEGFQAFYDRAILRRGTDPRLLTDLQRRLRDVGLFDEAMVDQVVSTWRRIIDGEPGATQPQLDATVRPIMEQFELLDEAKRVEFARLLTDYVRLYGFLSQILLTEDSSLEKLYRFARIVQAYLPALRDTLSDHDRAELMRSATLEQAGVVSTGKHTLTLKGQVSDVAPQQAKSESVVTEARDSAVDKLSAILQEINNRFDIPEEKSRPFVLDLRRRLSDDAGLRQAFAGHLSDTEKRLVFGRRVNNHIQEMLEVDFEMYKQINDNPDWAEGFVGYLCGEYEREIKRPLK